jgi:hypothetical protein
MSYVLRRFRLIGHRQRWQQVVIMIVMAALAMGACAWLTVGGVLLVDMVLLNPTPTLHVTTIRVGNVPTALPTVSASLTPSPILTEAASPTANIATQLAVIPTVDPSPTSNVPTGALTAADPPTVHPVPNTPGPVQGPSNSTGWNAGSNGCAAPEGWVAYSVQPGDTLFGFVLGAKGQTTVDAIMTANCLKSKSLAIGQRVFLPPGAGENSPKVDDSVPAPNADSAGPSGSTRSAKCPCRLQVRAGWRLEQIAAAVDSTPVGFSGAAFLAVTKAGAAVPDHGFLRSRPAGKSLEGFMYPGAYTLQNDTSAAQFRDMMLSAFGAAVSAQVQADSAGRNLSFWQVVVMASIIQRESYSASEQKLIASVFYNRMAAGKALASTVTLQYALGRPGNWWPPVGKAINTKMAYNTYIYLGLPPSPIGSPGLEAILAAVYPAQTDYLYFSAKCGGGGNFYVQSFGEFKQGLQCK